MCLVFSAWKLLFFIYDLLNKFFVTDHEQAANIEPEGSALHDSEYQLTKNGFSSLGRGKYSGTNVTYACN
jgi:hypothetical protein